MAEADYQAAIDSAVVAEDGASATNFHTDVTTAFPNDTLIIPNSTFTPTKALDGAGNSYTVTTTGALATLFGNASSVLDRPPQPPGNCLPVPDYYFSVSGIANWVDGQLVPHLLANTTVEVHVYIGWRDENCRLVLEDSAYQTTTTSGGTFSVNVESYYSPSQRPVFAFVATPTNVGKYKVASCIIPGLPVYYQDDWPQTLTRSQLTEFNSNGNVVTYPSYTPSDSMAWLFFWETRLDQVKSAWASVGFSHFFNAGYDPYFDSSEFRHDDYGFDCTSSVIRFGYNSKWDGWVVDHEAGHYWQYHKQGKQLAGGGTHDLCHATTQVRAFLEGFADYHANNFATDGERRPHLFFTYPNGELTSSVSCDTTHYAENGVADFFQDYFDNVNDATFDGAVDTILFGSGSPRSYLVQNWPGSVSTFQGWFDLMDLAGKFGSQEAAVRTLANHFTLF